MKYYLCISIGPVQDFIASARRCRDLWFGSHLLSEVSKAAALGLIEAGVELADLVFPSPETKSELKPDSPLNVANRIVALVEQPEVAASAAHERCQARLRQLAEKAFEQHNKDYFASELAWKQLDNLMEFYWVAVPLRDSNNYREVRSGAERMLAARKNSRLFAPVTWGAPVEKSSLDGQREFVFDLQKFQKSRPEGLRRWGLRPGEKLCGVSALKRLGSMHSDYRTKAALSTSHVASGTWIRRNELQDSPFLNQFVEGIRPLLINEMDLLGRDGQVDGHLLYEERLLTYVDNDRQADARALLKKLYNNTSGRPSPYYTILLADGDRMGVAIDGLDLAGHRKLTAALSAYASRDVPNIVRDHHGYLIYAGGDDILAMIPVDTVVQCSSALAREFAKSMKPFAKDGSAPTLSVGVAVRHHLDPLAQGLNAARRAEKKAKEKRNALAISLDKRSGGEILISDSWDALDRRLERFATYQGRISNGFAYELRNLGLRLETANPQQVEKDLILAEALRIAKRKSGERGTLKDSELDQLRNDLSNVGVKTIADELVVSRFLTSSASL